MSCHEYARVFLAFCCARIIVTCVHSNIRTISYSNLQNSGENLDVAVRWRQELRDVR